MRMGVGLVMRGVFRRGGIGRLRQFQSRLLSLSADETSGLFENAEGKPWSSPRDGPACRAGGLTAPARRSGDAGLRRFPSHPTRTPRLPPPVGKAGGVFLEEAITDRPCWQGLIFGRICLSRRVERRGAPWCRRDLPLGALHRRSRGRDRARQGSGEASPVAGERKVRAGQTWGVTPPWPVGLTPT